MSLLAQRTAVRPLRSRAGIAMRQGAFRYEADRNRLAPITGADLREAGLTPGQKGIDAVAPVTLIYVADSDRLQKWLESLDPDDLGKYKM